MVTRDDFLEKILSNTDEDLQDAQSMITNEEILFLDKNECHALVKEFGNSFLNVNENELIDEVMTKIIRFVEK